MKRLKRRGHLRDKGLDERIILKGILKKQYIRVLTGFIWLGIREDSSLWSINNTG
jgi:hypothetical protein